MTLVEQIEASTRLGEAYSKSENLAGILSEAKVLLSKIKEASTECLNVLQDYNAMQKAKLLGKSDNAEVMRILGDIRESVNAGEYETDRVITLTRECKSLHEEIEESWKKYIRKEIGTQKDIVDVLQVLISDTQRYVTLKNKYSAIISANTPGDENLISQIKTYRVLADQMIKEMDLEDSVLLFFQKLAAREVLPLSELTPEVFKWITDNDFEGKFTIKISER